MIRNIIFDLGNVLISFRPDIYLSEKKFHEEKIKIIMEDLFNSAEWRLLDNGDIKISEAIDTISLRSSLTKEEIARIFDLRTEIMFPLEQNTKVLPELIKRGYRLYFLSNFPGDIFESIKKANPFFRYFEGGIISAEVRLSKPDLRIYTLILEKYQLNPEESLFVDDLEINVAAARKAGMNAIVFSDSADLYNELSRVLSF